MKILNWLKKKDNFPISCIVYLVVLLWVTNLVFLFNDSDRGTFGDMFGAVNALFSGLAFAGVIYAILLQRQELTLQREELKLTRAELKRSAEAQEASEKALKIQAMSFSRTTEINMINALIQVLVTQIKEWEQRKNQGVSGSRDAMIKHKHNCQNEITKIRIRKRALEKIVLEYFDEVTSAHSPK